MANWFNNKSTDLGNTSTIAQAETSSSSYTLVCKSAVFEGNIHSDADVRIEGVLKGNLDIKGTLYVAPTGRVVAESVVCGKADVSGEISGSLTANEILYIRSGGTVAGDISVADMVVEQGGFFDGTSRKIRPAKVEPRQEILAGIAKQGSTTGNSQPQPPKTAIPH